MIKKKYKCTVCNGIIECDNNACIKSCSCKKITAKGQTIIEGVHGVDYTDVTPQLLSEG